jgi:hypothetical protein
MIRNLFGERGGVVVIVVVWLTSALTLVMFTIDVGNWFVHRRHLQMQADAAALAGGDSFGVPCSNTPVEANAYNYGGREANHATSLYNGQYDAPPADKFHLLINATNYWNKGGLDFTDGGHPCSTKFLDVKLTESPHAGLSFFGVNLLPTINAHARVTLFQETTKAGSVPIAFPNPLPKEAAAIFIDETKPTNDPNQIIAREQLSEVGAIGGGLDGWSGSGVSVPIASRSIGVVIATSGQTGYLSGATFSTGTLGAICSQALVSCYDATNNPPSNGVDFVRGYSSGNGQQPNPPALGDVELFYTGSCTDAWFMSTTAGCNVGIEAKIDARNSSGTAISPSNIEIKAISTSAVAGGTCLKPNQGCTLTFDSGSTQCSLLQGPGRCWRSTTIPMGNVTGPAPIFLNWKETSGSVNGKACTGNNCTGSFENGGVIQRSFNADDEVTVDNPNAGPLKVVTVYDCDAGAGCLTTGLQSFQIGTSVHLNVGIGIAGTLQNAQNKTDASALCGVNALGEHFSCLKVAVSNSGNTQALDCDPNANPWYNELARGCGPTYTVNDGSTVCPSKNTLWGSAQPWTCVATTTGAKKSDVAKGLNLRILGDTQPNTCPAAGQIGHNNWEMFDPTNQDTLGFPAGDPRLVQAYLTAYGAFSNTSGTSTTIPIVGFGSFYITGWTPGQGQGFANPCQGNGDDPVPGNNGGLIVGHFVRYVDKINSGGGTVLCDLSTGAFGNCVPVLTQ